MTMIQRRAASMPAVLLRFEGFFVLVAAIVLYGQIGASWWMFVWLILAPDLSMLPYLWNKRLGSAIYNLAHTYIWPLLWLCITTYWGSDLGLSLALIWIAHIGMDRTVGYGLKYPTEFKETHLNRV